MGHEGKERKADESKKKLLRQGEWRKECSGRRRKKEAREGERPKKEYRSK